MTASPEAGKKFPGQAYGSHKIHTDLLCPLSVSQFCKGFVDEQAGIVNDPCQRVFCFFQMFFKGEWGCSRGDLKCQGIEQLRVFILEHSQPFSRSGNSGYTYTTCCKVESCMVADPSACTSN